MSITSHSQKNIFYFIFVYLIFWKLAKNQLLPFFLHELKHTHIHIYTWLQTYKNNSLADACIHTQINLKNRNNITPIVIAAKVYIACFSVFSDMKARRFLEKIKIVVGEIHPQHHSFCFTVKSSKDYVKKNHEAMQLVQDFSKAFDSIHRGNIEQISLADSLFKKKNYSYNDAWQKHERYGSLN